MSDPTVQRLMSEAIVATRAGYMAQAHLLLRRVIELEPGNEQAWLWLSQVEDTVAGRRAALQQVLQINPASAAARRGLELLSQQPAGAQAGRPLAASPTGAHAPAATAAPAVAAAAPAAPAAVAPPATPTPAEDLGHMLAAHKPRWGLRGSEIVILLIGIASIFLVSRLVLGILFSDDLPVSPREQASQRREPAAGSEQPQPTSDSTAPTAELAALSGLQPVNLGALFSSTAYNLRINGTHIEGAALVVNVSLINQDTSVRRFNSGDFVLEDSAGTQTTLNAARSTVLSRGSTIGGRNELNGTLVFNLNTPQPPMRLIWRPTSAPATVIELTE